MANVIMMWPWDLFNVQTMHVGWMGVNECRGPVCAKTSGGMLLWPSHNIVTCRIHNNVWVDLLMVLIRCFPGHCTTLFYWVTTASQPLLKQIVLRIVLINILQNMSLTILITIYNTDVISSQNVKIITRKIMFWWFVYSKHAHQNSSGSHQSPEWGMFSVLNCEKIFQNINDLQDCVTLEEDDLAPAPALEQEPDSSFSFLSRICLVTPTRSSSTLCFNTHEVSMYLTS